METSPARYLAGLPRALETFLVEWKLGAAADLRPVVGILETFLVEWKRAFMQTTPPRPAHP